MKAGKRLLICLMLLMLLSIISVLGEVKVFETNPHVRLDGTLLNGSCKVDLIINTEDKNFVRNFTINSTSTFIDEEFEINLIRNITGIEEELNQRAIECITVFSNNSLYSLINCRESKALVVDQKQQCDTSLAVCVKDEQALNLCREAIRTYAQLNADLNYTLNKTEYEKKVLKKENDNTWITRAGVGMGLGMIITYLIVWYKKSKTSDVEKESGGDRIHNYPEGDL